MKQQTKAVLWAAGLAFAGFAAYKAWKYYKENVTDKTIVLNEDDIRELAETHKVDEMIEDHKKKLNNGVGESEDIDEMWYTNESGVLERRLTREEFLYGADYDMLTEELVENVFIDGTPHVVIRKLEDPILLNHRVDRGAKDTVESIKDMLSQISALRNVEMDYEERKYEADTMEALDYYIALLLDKAGIEDIGDRKRLMVLSTFEYTPNVGNDRNYAILERLRDNRFQHLGVSPHTRWASVAEVILFYAAQVNFNVSAVTQEESVTMMLENLGMDWDDRDVVINDIIISYFEHNRHHKPNYDGTFGLFGLPEGQYNESKCLNDEFEHYLANQTRLHGEIGENDIV